MWILESEKGFHLCACIQKSKKSSKNEVYLFSESVPKILTCLRRIIDSTRTFREPLLYGEVTFDQYMKFKQVSLSNLFSKENHVHSINKILTSYCKHLTIIVEHHSIIYSPDERHRFYDIKDESDGIKYKVFITSEHKHC